MVKKHKWVMRTVVRCRNGGLIDGRICHWLKLECGHIVTPYWNNRTFYVEGKTKSRCYECAKS